MPGGGALTFLPLQRIETRINVLLGFLGAQPLPQQRKYGGCFGRDSEGGCRCGERGDERDATCVPFLCFRFWRGRDPGTCGFLEELFFSDSHRTFISV